MGAVGEVLDVLQGCGKRYLAPRGNDISRITLRNFQALLDPFSQLIERALNKKNRIDISYDRRLSTPCFKHLFERFAGDMDLVSREEFEFLRDPGRSGEAKKEEGEQQ